MLENYKYSILVKKYGVLKSLKKDEKFLALNFHLSILLIPG